MKQLMEKQRAYFRSGETRSYEFRKKQLKKLLNMIQLKEEGLYHALKRDLNKSKYEAFTTEIGILYTEIQFVLKHLKQWMQDEEVKAPISHKGTKNYIMYEPYGVTLVISPWNYPIQLSLLPVITAVAAGNTVVLKPSELAPHTSAILNNIISGTFDEEYIAVIEGAKAVSESLLNERFDYIFFTGSTQVGKIVMESASKHLTPVTLELGGKSPAIIDKDADIPLSAKRIVWGKFTNAGQTCVAPDYIYIHEKVYKKFMKHVKKEIHKMYGKNSLENDNYVRIINRNHFDRLTKLMQSGTTTMGGIVDVDSLKISPTILENVTWEDPVMKQEIFGPILPVFTFTELNDVLNVVQENEKPLALYYFGSNKQRTTMVMEKLSFGGGCINDCLYHLANPHLPFGGVGESGMGAYHGKFGFETFSHRKAILKQTTLFDIPFRYPGGKVAYKVVKKIMS